MEDNNNIYKKLGDKIRILRLTKKISVINLAEQIGVSRQVLHGYESGQYKVPVHTLLKLSELLNFSIDSILKEKQAANPYSGQTFPSPIALFNQTIQNNSASNEDSDEVA